MSILDIFSFKKKFTEVFTAQNTSSLKELIKQLIKEQIAKQLTGEEKMKQVTDAVYDFCVAHFKSDNKLVQWVIDTFIIKNIRAICQSIYDDLKEIIHGL